MKVGDRASFTTPDGQKYIGKIEKINAKTIKIKAGQDTYMIKKPNVSLIKKTKKSVPKKPAPKKTAPNKPEVNKDLLQNVMGIMAEVAKDKGKSTKKEVDEKVALDKKAEKGKLKLQDFDDIIMDDDKLRDIVFSFEREMEDVQGYNMGYWVSRVSKRADYWDELTENQQQRLFEIMAKDIQIQTTKKMRAFWNENVKGKKFKSMKELKELFKKEYDETEFKH